MIALLCVSALGGAAFALVGSRAEHPLLDIRFLRVARFATPNIVAFCAYFATFAIFFFTALFLVEVSGFNGYQIAEVFLPMMVLMITASVLAGRWTSAIGVRWLLVGGCAIFALGLLLTNAVISPNPAFLPLAASLALTGIGIGTCVVPITSSVLAAVPPERSGMAASATNTSREVGAVIGVAVLGSLVNGRLHTDLIARLNQLKVPPASPADRDPGRRDRRRAVQRRYLVAGAQGRGASWCRRSCTPPTRPSSPACTSRSTCRPP